MFSIGIDILDPDPTRSKNKAKEKEMQGGLRTERNYLSRPSTFKGAQEGLSIKKTFSFPFGGSNCARLLSPF